MEDAASVMTAFVHSEFECAVSAVSNPRGGVSELKPTLPLRGL